MSQSVAHIVRVLNNNAVLVARDGIELVLASRGIGFGKKPGDDVEVESDQRKYVETSTDKVEFLKSLASLDPELATAVSRAVEIATELLPDLHPSVYVVLADHLSFAVQRSRAGQAIANQLLNEIRATFPTEFAAAEIIVAFVNSKLNVDLATDEAGYVALHLNAARTGTSVKKPLSKANELNRLMDQIKADLGLETVSDAQTHELFTHLKRVIDRIATGHFRNNQATFPIAQALPLEMSAARSALRAIANNHDSHAPDTEAALLAVFLHGWRQGV
ncbi:PRD domain-containing protein [Trueperella pecoris]|uniref:PRD domain-containing protein n=1 Tax=Trueperella pecoris TaxID=2733571 RepID=A0A7M1QVM0_9ACTO|nr:PRD domain-containing protein [Trueperella pecoris]QOR45375.1 PRD domain-containing protein [Trueperella pecoris]QTG75255.1 PRD domain-containing protein [Trueperella pecoris]